MSGKVQDACRNATWLNRAIKIIRGVLGDIVGSKNLLFFLNNYDLTPPVTVTMSIRAAERKLYCEGAVASWCNPTDSWFQKLSVVRIRAQPR